MLSIQRLFQQIDLSQLNHDSSLLIAGPTASAKSALALWLAQHFPAAIINADALQVYNNWHIITARPSPQDITITDHHLYGHVNFDMHYSVGHWLRELPKVIENVRAKGQIPIITGGTGLYFKALTEGIADIPAIDLSLIGAAQAIVDDKGLSALIDELDIPTREKIDKQNRQRVIRAWCLLKQTGQGLAFWHAQPKKALLDAQSTLPLKIMWSRQQLYTHIDKRFDAMVAKGALDEVRSQQESLSPQSNSSKYPRLYPAAKAMGVAPLRAYLSGEMTLDDAIESAKKQSRHFAKRQVTWFKNQCQNWQTLAG